MQVEREGKESVSIPSNEKRYKYQLTRVEGKCESGKNRTVEENR